MVSSISLVVQLVCISIGSQAKDLQRVERNLLVTSSASSFVPGSFKGAGAKFQLSNVLINLNPHRTSHLSPSQARSQVKRSPLISPSAIATSLLAPAAAFADDKAIDADVLKTKAFDLAVASLDLAKYGVEHAGDILIVSAFVGLIYALISSGFGSPGPRQGSPRGSPGFGGPAFLNQFGPDAQNGNKPKEFLRIERLNDKLESFDFSLQKAVVSESAAMRENQKLSFNRRFGAELASFNLDTKELDDIAKAEEKYRKSDARLRDELHFKLSKMRTSAMQSSNSSKGPMDGMMSMGKSLKNEVAEIQADRFQLETDFLEKMSKSLSSEQASRIAEIFKADEQDGKDDGQPYAGTLEAIRSLENIAASARAESKHVWVLKFNGDIQASQTAALRQEITALLRVANASRGDEAILVLNTGGGTVTGYGLAGAQLTRLKNAGIHLTVVVEQVAASGGYLMACVGDKIVSSPFAVIGSIGVITEIPNVYERLKKEGVEFSTVTAGKYKRTLTPTKKIEEQDKKKTKEDIERVLEIFKDFVRTSRPSVDIDKVATGETWLGPDALEQGLVDGLTTVDELLTDSVSHGAEVYSIKYQEEKTSPLQSLLGATAQGTGDFVSPTDWRELALSLLSQLMGLRTESVLPGMAGDSYSRSSTSQRDTLAAYEQNLMLKRPAGVSDPQLRWEGEKSTADLWHGL